MFLKYYYVVVRAITQKNWIFGSLKQSDALFVYVLYESLWYVLCYIKDQTKWINKSLMSSLYIVLSLIIVIPLLTKDLHVNQNQL